ncbi:MAG: diguanylate cyclase and metal dependent phosphohydrolase [Thermoleophilia bacterium]|nr:diguanylate cyclase and metal dependent phosphohydrolase [Thermoleophilia bacterium]
MPKFKFTHAFRQPGLSRKLTFAFGAVILVVAMSLPVSVYAFRQISSASDQARDSSTTLQTIARFQRSVGDVRATARDLADRQNTALSSKTTSTLQVALEAARCISEPAKCEAPFRAGERLPQEEIVQWERIAADAAQARETFETALQSPGHPRVAVAAFDTSLAESVDKPAQALTELVVARGISAQSEIKAAIYRAMVLLIAALGGAILLAALLATFIPRRLMARLEHLRQVAHSLARGDMTARADEKFATRNDEIGDLISDFNLMAMALQQQNGELRTVQEQLHISLQQEQERSTRDPLTGLRNHRYFQDSLRAEIERCRRSGGHVTIAMLDLDNFKQVNDRFGHSEGDAVLRRATKGITDNLRPYDLACRLGGEEFGVIFPEATAEEAKEVMDRIAEHILPFGPNGERLSFSGGITTWPLHAQTQADLFHRADEASYAAKMAGKAATMIYDPAKVSSMDSEDRTKQRSRDAMLTTATTLVASVDAKDPYTRNHSEMVAIYAATIARAMRLDEATVKLVYRAGLLHDVGKIGISDEILVKGDQLTHDEWIQLRMHPDFSYRILQAAELEPVATWTRHHHEHFDGTGYPMQLGGQDIPLGSRIILVADAFEAMTSDRVYRRALGVTHAVHELRTGAGSQFDPQVVQTMVDLVEAGVFIQVMQQYGRVIEPVMEAVPEQVAEQPTAPAILSAEQQQAAAWAQQQIDQQAAQQQPPQAA